MSDELPRVEWGVIERATDLHVISAQLIDIAEELRAERRLSTNVSDRQQMQDNALGAEDWARVAREASRSADYWFMYETQSRVMQAHIAARQILDGWRADRKRAESTSYA